MTSCANARARGLRLPVTSSKMHCCFLISNSMLSFFSFSYFLNEDQVCFVFFSPFFGLFLLCVFWSSARQMDREHPLSWRLIRNDLKSSFFLHLHLMSIFAGYKVGKPSRLCDREEGSKYFSHGKDSLVYLLSFFIENSRPQREITFNIVERKSVNRNGLVCCNGRETWDGKN